MPDETLSPIRTARVPAARLARQNLTPATALPYTRAVIHLAAPLLAVVLATTRVTALSGEVAHVRVLPDTSAALPALPELMVVKPDAEWPGGPVSAGAR